MGKKEKKLKNKLFWTTAAIASSLLFSQVVLGTPVSAAENDSANTGTSGQSSQDQTAPFHEMNQHSNAAGATTTEQAPAAQQVVRGHFRVMARLRRQEAHRQIYKPLRLVR